MRRLWCSTKGGSGSPVEPQGSERTGQAARVGRMVLAIHERHLGEIEGAYAVQTCDIHPRQAGVGPADMVGIDAAGSAEPVRRGSAAESVFAQVVLSDLDRQITEPRLNRDRAAHPTERTGTTSDRGKTVRQVDTEPHRASMAAALQDVSRYYRLHSNPPTALGPGRHSGGLDCQSCPQHVGFLVFRPPRHLLAKP